MWCGQPASARRKLRLKGVQAVREVTAINEEELMKVGIGTSTCSRVMGFLFVSFGLEFDISLREDITPRHCTELPTNARAEQCVQDEFPLMTRVISQLLGLMDRVSRRCRPSSSFS